ncbi:MAG: TlpA disulfide reductase family protein [Halofilum sp. (in: g-proteobacteria)]|nr:TlpA disulfide reductase family protein [Halofilum sp. (in: g-proteobacteria)]
MNHRPWLVVVAAGALGLVAGTAVDRLRAPDPAEASLDQAIQSAPQAPRVVGTASPAVELPGLDGQPRSLAEFDGRVILLNFWATWCPPCLEEIPALSALQAQLGNRGLQVIGLALDEREATREFAAELGIDYPVLIGGDAAFALSERFGNLPATLPYTAVIDREGIIRAVHRGALTQSEAADLVRPYL